MHCKHFTWIEPRTVYRVYWCRNLLSVNMLKCKYLMTWLCTYTFEVSGHSKLISCFLYWSHKFWYACRWKIPLFIINIAWRENFMVIKFYDSPLNCLDKKLTNFDSTEAQFCARCHGHIYIVDFHLVYRYKFYDSPSNRKIIKSNSM